MLVELPEQFPLKGGLFPQQHSQLGNYCSLEHIQVNIPDFLLVQVHFDSVNDLFKFHQLIAQVEDFYIFLDDHFVGRLQLFEVKLCLFLLANFFDFVIRLVARVCVVLLVAVFEALNKHVLLGQGSAQLLHLGHELEELFGEGVFLGLLGLELVPGSLALKIFLDGPEF